MMEKPSSRPTHRVTSSDDLEVSTYLELAEQKSGDSLVSSPPRLTPPESIVVVDFGSQYSMLIARRIRESRVYCEIIPHTASWDSIASINPKGVVLSGGPASVYDENAPSAPSWIFNQKLPTLGICYGMQTMVHQLGGKVASASKREYGHSVLHQNIDNHPLFLGLPSEIPVWMSHADHIVETPIGFKSLAFTENSPVAALTDGKQMFGIQFHPEVAHTPHGKQIIENFVFNVCECKPLWTPGNFISDSIKSIKSQVGDGRVICALSGGVDSAVAATLVNHAVGDQLTCIFVNNGLMRREEPERVLNTFNKYLELNLKYVDATEEFLNALAGVTDPEIKRKIIGEEFIKIFESQAKTLSKVDFLTQGTLYPDVIESETQGDSVSAKIKTHHNVGGLPESMQLELVEPLRYLFKDEVREIGLELGLPEEMVYRQPFPGPGLSIRVMGEVNAKKLETLRGADWVVMDEIKSHALYRELWQGFAVLTDTKTVGVSGDFRTYNYTVAIRAVTSEDAMTSDWARLPYDVLARISNRITNEVPGVNRVVYDITSKPPGTIEWE